MLALATRGLQPGYDAAIDAYRSLTRFAGLGVWRRSVIARDEEQRAQATKIANEPFDSQERQALVGEIESKLGDLFPEQFRPNTKTGMASWAMLELIMRELLEQTAKFGDGPIGRRQPTPTAAL